jgi:uncharacterized membrane protein YhaH (DUF805 family)
MSFTDAIQSGFSNYANFQGRALRSEYWFFALGIALISLVAQLIDRFGLGYPVLGTIVSLGTIIPSLAVATRRLHDTDRSGWWQLLLVIPRIGVIVLIVWYATIGTPGTNRFGPARGFARGNYASTR